MKIKNWNKILKFQKGILLSNKRKYTIGVSTTSSEDEEEEEEDVLAAEENANANGGGGDEKIDLGKLRDRIRHKQLRIRKYIQKTASSSSISGAMFSQTSNLNLKNVTNNTDELSMRELNQTPIDTPLLMLCCVYNCHNLLNQANSLGDSVRTTSSSAVGGSVSRVGSSVDLAPLSSMTTSVVAGGGGASSSKSRCHSETFKKKDNNGLLFNKNNILRNILKLKMIKYSIHY